MPEYFEVYPENWQAFLIFEQLSTQWRVGGMGAITGLDYSALAFVFDLHNVDDKTATFEQIRLLESGALQSFNKKRK